MPDTHRSNTRPSIKRSGRSYFFEKLKAKIVPSTTIFVDCWRSRSLGINFYTFNEKKHRALYLNFSKGLRFWLLAVRPVSIWAWETAQGRGRGGGGEEKELPLLIENYMDHSSWNVSHAQTEIQRPHTEAIYTKIKNYGQEYRSCLLPRSLSIAVDWDL